MINFKRKDNALIIDISGYFENNDYPEIEKLIQNEISNGMNNFLFSFEKLESLSSLDIRFLISINKKIVALNGKINFSCINENVKNTIKLVALDKFFNIYETDELALKSF